MERARSVRSRLWIALGFVVCVCPFASAQNPTTAAKKPAGSLTVSAKQWKGDLDGMIERRIVRVLVVYSKTQYFVVNGTQRGVMAEMITAMQNDLNQKFPAKQRSLRIHVVPMPTTRDQLLPRLTAGLGDIVMAGLTITPERQKIVDFVDPMASGISEIAVTGPGSPSISSVDDLSGKEVFVRKSSSYWESLQALNTALEQRNKAPVKLRLAPEDLEDEDLLEMLNAGLVKIVVVDDYVARLWSKIYTHIEAHPEIILHANGQFAPAIRKDSPKLTAYLNSFVRTHRQGTTFGNTVIRRYVESTAMIKSATAPEELKKFGQTVQIFQKYSGQYDMDYLLMMAQGYQESGLNQNVKSNVGAIGVMQLMPATGSQMDVGDIHQVEANVHAGVKYIRFMVDKYYANEPMDNMNKVLFAFAAYNAGPARIAQLRKLAAGRGLNPDVWIGNVEVVAAEKIGMETVTYVANIYKYYVAYKLVTESEAERQKSREALEKQSPH